MTKRFARQIASTVLAAAVGTAWAQAPRPVAAGQAADPADAAEIRFAITRYDVSGNTLLSAAEVDATLQAYTGAGRNFGDVQQALEALEAAYQARGFKLVAVQLPEQELNQGVVRLNVVQSVLGQVVVSGNRVVSQANVLAAMPTLQRGRTPDLDAVSANLRMANENPARKISLKLQGGADGEIDARLDVADEKAWKAMLNLDNSGTGPTGDTHVGVVLQHANLFGRDHVGSFQYTTTAEEPSKVSVYGLGYHIPLYLLGDSVDLYASYSDVDSGSVSAGLFDLAVSGRGSVFGARYNHTLARRGNLDMRLVAGVDVKAFKNSVLFAGENFGNDVTVHPVSLSWTAAAPWSAGQANLAFTLVHNIPGGSRGGSADIARARAGAKAAYNILRFSGAYSQALAGDWQLRSLVNGQLTGDALVPGEQFGAGGGSSVRGLDERAISTDSGYAASVELYSPNLCGAGRWQCRALAFTDAARGKRHQALPGETLRASAVSAGAGLRFMLGAAMNLQLDYGQVVHDSPALGSTRHKLHVRASLAY